MNKISLLFSNKVEKKFIGKYIAVVNGKIVAVGKDSIDAFNQMKKMFPDKKEGMGVYYIPTKKELVTCLLNFHI